MHDTQNINELINLDIDYIGMIFYTKSLRNITSVPDIYSYYGVKKIGVFVNADEHEIMNAVHKYDLQAVQLHGAEEASLCKALKSRNLEVFKAFGINDYFDFINIESFHKVCDMFIFDTKTKQHGGSGKKFNWNKLKEYKGETSFLLSGGISPNDIEEVLNFEHPKYSGIDLNSGFEVKPALKDIELLNEFVNKYRNN